MAIDCSCGCKRQVRAVVSQLVDNADPHECTPCVRLTVSREGLPSMDIKLDRLSINELIYTLQNIRNTGKLT